MRKKREHIVINDWKSWESADVLEIGPDYHELHFGCYLKPHEGSRCISIDTVEHARKVIKALEEAISRGWLFTEEEIHKYHDRATDTRNTLLEKRTN